MNQRWIAHLDMDAFYASVELLRYPDLRGQPVVIGGRAAPPALLPDGSRDYMRLSAYAGRGVVTTATYEARTYGVHSAMGLMKAAQLAPDAILLPVDFSRYRDFSRRFKAAVAEVAPHIEDRGVDEIYIDLSEHEDLRESCPDEGALVPAAVRTLALRLQQAVMDATGLSCSIGVTPNKLLSKMASEFNKPGGVTVLGLDEVPARIWPLPASRINGIGPKTTERLRRSGIETIGDLARCELPWLKTEFGTRMGAWLYRAARGEDTREVQTESEPKSVSRESTFERDLHPQRDKVLLGQIFTRLCVQLSEDLMRKGVAGRTVGIKLRYEDFQTVTRDFTLPYPTQDARTIRRAAGNCLKRVPLDRRLRLLGVKLTGLAPMTEGGLQPSPSGDPYTLPLFEDAMPLGG
ncbi:DNA polymerase IV [Kerstersia gyiorum]|jgi:DNA polymerase-4|uniref:DNA polymerase IV n=1 Tax=Kerstersia gyiorum TaxID=206506 RepID=UPI00242E2A77|nr:DNA polymerase IV [Kerstersia gyiorum]MCH4273281.1 DNA polymerase IV [Kerstersia gyiorum]MCI1229602.1 DNA polymerase IV [Kerstersia gyiorum]